MISNSLSKKNINIERLQSNVSLLMCPLCQSSIIVNDQGLTCTSDHHFDISKKGYVNFLQRKGDQDYNQTLYKARKNMIHLGLFDGIIETIKHIVDDELTAKPSIAILDAGCGDGSLLSKLINSLMCKQVHVFGIDLSKDAISLATSNESAISWMIADLAKLPIKPKAMDAIINILSPANYQQFRRVLKDDGLCIKVIPNTNHFKQLREHYQIQNLNENHATKAINHFKNNMHLFKEIKIEYDFKLNDEQQDLIQAMSPMSKHGQANNKKPLTHITIDVVVCVGHL